MILEFRIWDEVGKKMIYNPMIKPSRIYANNIDYGFVIKSPNNTETFIETNNVMMNTQLEDYNGTPIYEGDELSDIDDEYYYGIVKYDNEDGTFYAGNGNEAFRLSEINGTCEIIGTKYDKGE